MARSLFVDCKGPPKIDMMPIPKLCKGFVSSIRIFCGLMVDWIKAVRSDMPKDSYEKRVLIIPCDPWGVVGSRGDQAMVLSVKHNCEGYEIDILTDSHESDNACREIGLNPLTEWSMPFDVWMKDNVGNYKEVYILGADVTDGVYGWPTAMKLLMFYDCFSRLGVKTRYLGFSWSETPSLWMHLVFPILKQQLPLPVRDPVSYERVARFTRHRPLVQVADAAFQLKPNSTSRAQKWIDWCLGQKSAGRRVVAINIHQMFNDAETKSADWEKAFSRSLEEVSKKHQDIVYLLVPHDNRPNVSDLEILKRINSMLPNSTLIDVVMNADEIKAVLGVCDALIAGRMHISIAALGQAVPVLGLVYQGKFEGLWQLFELPVSSLLEPRIFLADSQSATRVVDLFVGNIGMLSARIKRRLPAVMALSAKNFA